MSNFILQPLADVVKHVEKGYKMESPEGCPSEVYDIMRQVIISSYPLKTVASKILFQAWDLDPEKRPYFRDVKNKLHQLMTKHIET